MAFVGGMEVPLGGRIREWRRGEAEAVRFLATISAPLALLFALVIIMQGMAVGMVGCAR